METIPDYQDYTESTPDEDEDYIPESCSSEGSSVRSIPLSTKKRAIHFPHSTPEINDPEDPADEDQPSTSAIIIPKILKKSDGSRVYNKKLFCLFCFKPFHKMARHLEQVHANEREVASALGHPKGSKERRVSMQSISNEGNYIHNAEVIRTGRGELVPRKRPMMKAERSNFMHCFFCHGLFLRKVLWRHNKTCAMQPKSSCATPGKKRVQNICAFMELIPSHINEKLCTTSQDKITHDQK